MIQKRLNLQKSKYADASKIRLAEENQQLDSINAKLEPVTTNFSFGAKHCCSA